jgi:hypothetical protein
MIVDEAEHVVVEQLLDDRNTDRRDEASKFVLTTLGKALGWGSKPHRPPVSRFPTVTGVRFRSSGRPIDAMQQLLLTPVTVQAVRGLVQRGHGLRLSYDTLKLRKVDHAAYRLVIPHGFLVHFDTGFYRPGCLCRHMSVQGRASGRG